VASENALADVSFGEEVLKTQADVYRRLRNTLRWLLGNLNGFDPARDSLRFTELQPLDRWLLTRLAGVVEDVGRAMEAFELHKAYARLTGFCAGELSSLVFDIHKDTLYTLARADPRRLSAQSALYEVLQALVRMLSPILVFTAEEAWEQMPAAWKHHGSVHHSHWPEARAEWKAGEVEDELDLLIEKVRPVVSKRLEEARAAKLIGHPYDAKVALTLHSKKLRTALHAHEALLPQLFIVSGVAVDGAAPQDGLQVSPEEVVVTAASGHKCPRCWRRPGDVKADGLLCGRCEAALA
jgi:isoleucyl-tRNA synthetase